MADPHTSAPPQPLPLKEVAALLVKHYGLQQGLWELALEMQVAIGQFGAAPEAALPGAAFGVTRVGLVRVEQVGPRTVDAAEINRTSTSSTNVPTSDR